MFETDGTYINAVDHKNKFMNVQGATDSEGRHVQANENKSGKIHQQWEIVFVDQWKGEPTKG
jgi:hypothetical protein